MFMYSSKANENLQIEIASLGQLEKLKKLRLTLHCDASILSFMQALSTKNVPIEDLVLEYARIGDDTVLYITRKIFNFKS